jgi:hypothetical protein
MEIFRATFASTGSVESAVEAVFEAGKKFKIRKPPAQTYANLAKDFRAACVECNADPVRVRGKSRHRRDVEDRRAVWVWLRNAGYSYPLIGHATNNHHTTVMAGLAGLRP